MTWFDESRLDDEQALAIADLRLRALAESGSRVRRELGAARDAVAEAVARREGAGRPRAVVAAGPDSRLLRVVLEPTCPVPFVAWPSPGLPGWVGSLDLVVVLAPQGADPGAASAVAEAGRRGAQVVVASPAASLVGEHASGRDTTLLPAETTDPLALAVVMLTFLDQVQLGPATDAEAVAAALDEVAVACSPYRDLAVNPAKSLAIALADTSPVVWGGSALAARAARRVAEELRRAMGRSAIAGDAEHLLPVLEAARVRDVFADPFDASAGSGQRGAGEARPGLLVLDDGDDAPLLVEQRRRLVEVADARGVRVEIVSSEGEAEMARYASLLLQGRYVAEYLRVGLVED
ncbi:SIS domain-containing protein [Nocardioides sp. BP30]|uniref:SIS domain-containing protein n=1 Tax=Nocardioides sp. BP30 TaxID=3036374 RepID=UPI0024688759|nr:SIS domain-containing protein [Nocardioides sp. BP30]WGL51504.1 SIS domain-containing protein [Nocardioides sp. BP30]